MRSENEANVMTFSVKAHSVPPHTQCLSSYCLKNNGIICLTEEYQNYLKNSYKVIKELIKEGTIPKGLQLINYRSDWDYVFDSRKNQAILSKSGCQRLRYIEHSQIGKNYIEKIFTLWKDETTTFPITWEGFKGINSYYNTYKTLVRQAELQSEGEIYRLFDLCGTRNSEIFLNPENKLKIFDEDFLATFFALRKGANSISQFAAFFEFFRKFHDDYKDSIAGDKKAKNANSIRFLATNEGFQTVDQLWNKYFEAAAKLFNPHFYIKAQNDQEFVDRVRNQLRQGSSHLNFDSQELLMQKQSEKTSPYPQFNNQDLGTYHTFKHKDLLPNHSTNSPLSNVSNYLLLIKDIILTGNLSADSPPRPDQFGSGRIYTFEKIISTRTVKPDNPLIYIDKKQYVKVVIKKTDDSNTITLTCM